MKDGFVPRPKLADQYARDLRNDPVGARAAWHEAMAKVDQENMTAIARSTDDNPPPAGAQYDYVGIQKEFKEFRAKYGRHAVREFMKHSSFRFTREWFYSRRGFLGWSTKSDPKK
jgi:hypothetical protein